MDTVIRAAGAADFLALVPHLVGFRPHDSLVMVGMRGNRTHGAVRMGLPGSAETAGQAAIDALVHSAIAVVCRLSGVDAVVPVVYTAGRLEGAARGRGGTAPDPAGWAGGAGTALIDAVTVAAHDAGFEVADAFCVASDGWFSYLDGDRPDGGHPRALLEESERTLPEEVRELRDPAEAARIPSVPAAFAAEVAAEAERAAEHPRPGSVAGQVASIERALEQDAEPLPARRLAELAVALTRPGVRDAFMMQAAFGPEVGELALASSLRWDERHAADGRSVDDIIADELEDGAVDGETLLVADLMAGRSAVRPDPGRVERAMRLLVGLVAAVPERLRPAPLTVLAWLAWALGRSSRASVHVAQALRIDPEHGMAGLIDAMLSSGILPEWAFSAR